MRSVTFFGSNYTPSSSLFSLNRLLCEHGVQLHKLLSLLLN